MKILRETEIKIASVGCKGVRGRSGLGWVFIPTRLLTEKVDKDYVLVVKALPSEGASAYVATEVVSVTAPTPIPSPQWLYGIVNRYNSTYGFVEIIGEHPFSKPEVFIHNGLFNGNVPEVNDRLYMLVGESDKGPAARKARFGSEITVAVDALLTELHADEGTLVDTDEQSDVDSLMADYARETQVAIGQLPPEVEAAPTKPRREKRKNSEHGRTKASRQHACSAEVLDKPIDISAAVAVCTMNGSGGAMAYALRSAAGVTAH